MNKRLVEMTIVELSSLIRYKELSPVELIDAIFEQVIKYNDKINAFLHVESKKAKHEAMKAENEISKGIYRGMLHGIPIGVKDNIDVKGEFTTVASKIHKHEMANEDATVIKNLKSAGAIPIGKLNMHEYAFGASTNNPHFGACRNPWNINTSPGGSSGGSGAAVAADMCIASIGTDTMGSIRMPSSACGVVGLKPTQSRISNEGCFPSSITLDHIGPMTKTTKDAAIILGALENCNENRLINKHRADSDYLKYITGDISNLTIGINEDYLLNEADSDIVTLVKKGILTLENLGAKVEEIEIPTLKYVDYIGTITSLCEGTSIHRDNLLTRPDDYGEDTRLLFTLGGLPSAVDYLQAQKVRQQMTEEFREVFKKVDVIISPTLPILLPEVNKDYFKQNIDLVGKLGRFLGSANLTGFPAISIPCGLKRGMPVGMQIIGNEFAEKDLLNIAHTFELTNPLKGVKAQSFID